MDQNGDLVDVTGIGGRGDGSVTGERPGGTIVSRNTIEIVVGLTIAGIVGLYLVDFSRWLWPLVGVAGLALYLTLGRRVPWAIGRDALRTVAMASVIVAAFPAVLVVVSGLFAIAAMIVVGILLLLLLRRVL